MKIGLIGLPSVGKTTFFQLLTKNIEGISSSKTYANIGIAKVPDDRIVFLSEVYKPKKITYATIEVIDIQGIQPSQSVDKNSSHQFLEAVRQADALVHVVRAFEDDNIFHTEGTVDPLRDIETLNMELLFADLGVIENRIHRIKTGKKITPENQKELKLLERCKESLETGELLNNMDLNDDEKQILRSYDFLTERPLILLINLDDDQFATRKYKNRDKIIKLAEEKDIPLIEVCAKFELEINELDKEDREVFMEEMGIKETGIEKLASVAYDLLGLISFITAGEGEVRAWPIKKGSTAKEAGGKIHSDIARGFIRAEVVKFKDFETHKSMQKLREEGLVKLEGKESIIEDGDMINFRFNV